MKTTLFVIMGLSLLFTGSPSSSYAQEQIPVTFEDVNIDGHCFVWGTLVNVPQYERDRGEPFLEDEIIIDTEKAYIEFQEKSQNARNMACADVHFPPVDFFQKTLLVKSAMGSCAATGFKKQVLKDDRNKKIIYKVNAIERGMMACSGPGLDSMNIITIPKIPKDYTVEFVPLSNKNDYQSYHCENGKMVARDWYGDIVEPKNTPPPGGGVFGVKMNCSEDIS